ncbi:MAG: NAD-dependent epimerase/dehydratase family protein [Candidatus Aenigmarchaeota archaeon]|nr:NAD-dependent epimerase/dehydratase family protein [Candidatus Aenigmarchaeota archaeon]
MKILVVGATGFIGKELVKKLREKFPKAVIYELSRHGKIKCDLARMNDVCIKKLSDIRFDLIIFLAAKIWYTWLPSPYPYKTFYAINVLGMKRIIQTTKAKKFIYISSLAVLGKSLRKIKPRGFYGLSKYIAERECIRLLDRRCLIIRLPMIYDAKEMKLETKIFYSLRFLIKLLKSLTKKISIRVLSRNEAINKIISSLSKKGIIAIYGKKISIYDFVKTLEKERKAIQCT